MDSHQNFGDPPMLQQIILGYNIILERETPTRESTRQRRMRLTQEQKGAGEKGKRTKEYIEEG